MQTVNLETLVAADLRSSIDSLENSRHDVPVFYTDKDKDDPVVNHLIHCLKVTHDYYSTSNTYFDYSEVVCE